MAFIMIYVTFENMKQAEEIAKSLIENHVVSCANLFPIKSFYWWKGKIENSEEGVGIFKTRPENWEKVQKEIKKLHSYETPCVVKIDAESSKDFEKWIYDETK